MTAYTGLVIVHVLLFAYWLGADWGVFVTARFIADPELPLAERRRFLQAALSIDLMPRIAFTLLLPVGFQIATFYAGLPQLAWVSAVVWLVALVWLGINVQGYRYMGTSRGERLRGYDQQIRWVLAPVLIAGGVAAPMIKALAMPLFIALKLVVFGLMIFVGLMLRSIMRQWAIAFARLAAEGRSPAIDAVFSDSMPRARRMAYTMWTLSIVMAVLGVSRLG